MKKPLSHSAVSKYNECGKAYELHYNKRWRSVEQSAALLFGTAIDKALEAHLLKTQEPMEVFFKTWQKQEINGTPTELHDCTKIVYADNDLDVDILDESDYTLIAKTYSIEDVLATIDDIIQRKREVGFKNLSLNDKKIFNHLNWLCMNRKGIFIVKAAVEWIDENVLEVLKTQEKIELEDSNGDQVTGYADLVARVKGQNKPVIIDFKTSASMYDADAVTKSPQLALYVFSLKHKYEQTNTAGFVVFQKNIRKNKTKICRKCGHDGSGGRHRTCDNVIKQMRCGGQWIETINPTVSIQFLVDEISEFFQQQVVENYNEVNKAIKAEIFPRNWKACVQYNGKVICPYFKYCHQNKIDDIIELEEK